MTGRDDATPIEDHLDELLRRTRADARTTRRLLDEAGDHLYATAAELESAGAARLDAEREAVHRFGPVPGSVRGSWRRAVGTLILETLRAAVLLGAWGLVAVGLSGGIVAVMNALFGLPFVGAATVFDVGGASIAETARDAVSLRVLAGLAGLVLLGGYAIVRRRRPTPVLVLPRGLTDALGAAAFAAAAAVLTAALIDQAATGSGTDGVGWFLSGALVSAAGAVVFSARATHALLPARV